MELVIKKFKCLPCSLEVFTINGQNADRDDFGSVFDHDELNAQPYCCKDMRFESKPIGKGILKKYGITDKEYKYICNELQQILNVGSCGWCA